ncbi:TetR/AcrR family transcriptional regulator [Puteibacter caeruleilacunae]|nr:TetR/AcrR family transcriptional regulator [Puteibacter caeruleilacunae]
MQTQKDNIRDKILEVARNEFLEKGYKMVSMRYIAKQSEVGLSNIYNYFRNKDEILREVLNPLMQALDHIMEEHNKPEHLSLEVFNSEQLLQEHIFLFTDLIENYKKELHLILYNAHGSCYENFREEYTNHHTQMGYEYLNKMKEKFPAVNIQISEFFIHTMSSAWLSVIGEIVSHDLPKPEMEQFFGEYMTFCTAGWKQLMKV